MFIFHKIRNLLFRTNNDIRKKNEYKKCVRCDGSGIILLEKPIICKNCNGTLCYMCENKGTIRVMDECDLCFGRGNIIN